MPFPAKTNSEAILASAADIIRAGGLNALSMRTLAGRLGVRASSLYRHFPDRSSIERSLAINAAAQLLERMRQAVETLNGERAVFAAARAYLDYATSEAAFYEMLMESIQTPPQSSDSTRNIWKFFVRLVSEMTNMGEDTAGAVAVWSFLHGFAVLCKAGELNELSTKLTFARGTQALVRGLSVADAESVRGSA